MDEIYGPPDWEIFGRPELKMDELPDEERVEVHARDYAYRLKNLLFLYGIKPGPTMWRDLAVALALTSHHDFVRFETPINRATEKIPARTEQRKAAGNKPTYDKDKLYRDMMTELGRTNRKASGIHKTEVSALRTLWKRMPMNSRPSLKTLQNDWSILKYGPDFESSKEEYDLIIDWGGVVSKITQKACEELEAIILPESPPIVSGE